MNIWEVTILQIIKKNNGRTSLKELYSNIPSYIDLDEHHREITFNAPNYHHQTRAHIDDLLDKRELARVGRGIYSLTQKGLRRLI